MNLKMYFVILLGLLVLGPFVFTESDQAAITLLYLGGGIAFLIYGFFKIISHGKKRKRDIEKHKSNLIKGGLIPKAPKSIHREAMNELGRERPHGKLPRARYFDDYSQWESLGD